MATFSLVPVAEAQQLVLPPRRAIQERYKQIVGGLAAYPEQEAGHLELEDGDRPITESARLKAAAKSLGLQLAIRRRGNVLVFWPTGARA